MNETFKNWMPITKRNRVAMGFAFAALLMFVAWNVLPMQNYFDEGETYAGVVIWPQALNPDYYLDTMKHPDWPNFLVISLFMSLIQCAPIVLLIAPFWKIFSKLDFIRIMFAVANLAGGLLFIWVIVDLGVWRSIGRNGTNSELLVISLIPLCMLTLSASLFFFRSELELHAENQIKKTLEGGVHANDR